MTYLAGLGLGAISTNAATIRKSQQFLKTNFPPATADSKFVVDGVFGPRTQGHQLGYSRSVLDAVRFMTDGLNNPPNLIDFLPRGRAMLDAGNIGQFHDAMIGIVASAKAQGANRNVRGFFTAENFLGYIPVGGASGGGGGGGGIDFTMGPATVTDTAEAGMGAMLPLLGLTAAGLALWVWSRRK